MALNKRAKVALAIAGTTVVVGGAVYLAGKSTPKKKKKQSKTEDEVDQEEVDPSDQGSPPVLQGDLAKEPTAVYDEPVGGWEHRWAQAKDAAIPECRVKIGESEVGYQGAWSAYWRCLAVQAFPETAGRLEPSKWPKWLREDAAIRIRSDVKDYLESQGVSTSGMTFMLWLRFDQVIDGCYDALAPHEEAIVHCVASEIYPSVDWPPEETSKPWQSEFWELVTTKVREYVEKLDQDPLPDLALTPI